LATIILISNRQRIRAALLHKAGGSDRDHQERRLAETYLASKAQQAEVF